MQQTLTEWQMEPTLADGGWTGLAALHRARKEGKPFPLMILDAHMPELDGFLLAERMKHDPRLAGATIMMLATAGQREDAARCRELDITAKLVKPIKQAELFQGLLNALEKFNPQVEQPGVTTGNLAHTGPRRLRILLAEDNLVNQKLVVRWLEKREHTVVVTSNGREALRTLEKLGPQGFDLILMDVKMPELDGFEATAAIREKEKATGGHLPIIALTAQALKGDRERCLQAGMDKYVSKPIRAQALFEAIEGVVSSEGSPPMPLENKHEEEVEDWDKALARVDGERRILADMIRLFRDESRMLLDSLREAGARHDASALDHPANTSQGASGHFAAQRLERIGREANLAHAEEVYLAFDEELGRVTRALTVPKKEASR